MDKDEYEFDSRFKKEGLQLTPDDIHKAIDENTASRAQRAIYSRNEKLRQDLQQSQKWKHRLMYKLGQESLLNEIGCTHLSETYPIGKEYSSKTKLCTTSKREPPYIKLLNSLNGSDPGPNVFSN